MLAAAIAPKLKLPVLVTVRVPIVPELDRDAMALLAFERVALPVPAITRLCTPLLTRPDKVRLFGLGALIVAAPVNATALVKVKVLAPAFKVVPVAKETLPVPKAELLPTVIAPAEIVVVPS
jgi:hypothetical protein